MDELISGLGPALVIGPQFRTGFGPGLLLKLARDQVPQGGERMMTSKSPEPISARRLLSGFVQEIMLRSADQDVDLLDAQPDPLLLAKLLELLTDRSLALDA